MAKSTAGGMKKSGAVAPQFDDRGPSVSAMGVASYAFLKNADTYAGGQPTHKITLTFDETDEAYKAMLDHILQFENKFRGTKNLPPVTTPACIKRDKVSNKPQIIFKVSAKEDANGGYIPIKVADAKGVETETPVWQGDVVRVRYSLGGIKTAMYCGSKPYLMGVQLVQKAVNANQKSKFSWDDVSEVKPKVSAALPDESGDDLFA